MRPVCAYSVAALFTSSSPANLSNIDWSNELLSFTQIKNINITL